MSNPQLGLVMTTIGDGAVLEGYCRQAERENVRERLDIIVIPDRKSPHSLYDKCHALASRGFRIECPSIPEQEAFTRRFGNLDRMIPYDSDNRRNIGYLLALDRQCECIISIDDDNLCNPDGPVFSEFALVCGGPQRLPTVHSHNGWFNICELLSLEPEVNVYPRGFPYAQRHRASEAVWRDEDGVARLNAGLWLDSPDLDGMTWLAGPVRAVGWKQKPIFLGARTWSPINTQNTSLHREVVAAYYFVRMGYRIGGLPIDRYGDIFSGYFAQACVRHLGHRVRVGGPAAHHVRNSHHYLRDAANEIGCIGVLEDLLPWLTEQALQGATYADAYLCLADLLDEQIERFSGWLWSAETRAYFHSMTYCMRKWTAVCREIG